MDSRLDLHENLCNIIGLTDPIDGDRHVYFQPPESVKMKYPAIRYKIKGYRKVYANDGGYRLLPSYEVILIDKNADSIYFEDILLLPFCSFDRSYVFDNLNHFIFTIYT